MFGDFNKEPPIIFSFKNRINKEKDQFIIAQWLAQRFAPGEVPGSNSGKGENLIISD